MTKRTPHLRFVDPVQRTYEVPADLLPGAQNVLLVEDDVALADLLQEALELHGWRVSRAKNGKEGVESVLAEEYDVILCDMVMPGFPGDMFYHAVERVRPHLCGRFLFMTGHKGDRRILEFIRSIKGLIIWKPFALPNLLDAMNLLLGKRRSGGVRSWAS